ncbi:MAG: MBL fold metallo-hydrolase [Candidatus Tectomicrobia bacterium]|uniref:MBL fold metallo-hydrolase n=1 Tax=Tectimicrobiota bacterium TaxID=2528274 RepID=A0A932FXH3_UNCTE|nr:MBL fold metallo-hydrolase [Candidatus Tectomicrobia bacterium]
MRVTPRVALVSVQSHTFQPLYTTTNIYLIGGEKEVVMFDGGYAHEEAVQQVARELQELGSPKVRELIISHSHHDHWEGAGAIQKMTGARILAHRLDIPAIEEGLKGPPKDHPEGLSPDVYPFKIDGTLGDGERVQVAGCELEVIHTPGHSPGHLCLYLKEEGILFTGDHIVGISTVTVAPPHGDMIDYLNSLQKLLRYPAERLFPAHGPIMENAHDKIREYYAHRLERERQIVRVLQEGGEKTPRQLMMKIYAVELDERFYEVAEKQILGHLGKLEKEGRVASCPGEGEERRYTMT